MKKLISLVLLVLLLLLTLCSCGKNEKYPLVIGGEYVPPGVYCYYLDKVKGNSAGYKVKKGDKAGIIAEARRLCSQYVALNKFMKENNIALKQYHKSEAIEKTDNYWSIFKDYYRKIGVSKADLLSVQLCEKGKSRLVEHYFGKGSKNEVSLDDLKQSFVELYVGFKAIEAELTKVNTKGETITLSESEKKEVLDEFYGMKTKLNGGGDIDKINASYCKRHGLVATQSLQVNLMRDGDPMYDDDFFENVSRIYHGYSSVIESGKSVYLVQRVTIATSDEDAFAVYETEVLEHLKMPWVEKKLNEISKGYEVTEHKSAGKLEGEYFKAVNFKK